MLLEATSSNSSHPPPSSTLIAFKPRQVLLAQRRTVIMKQTKSLEPRQKNLLLHSVLRYVEKCGFSKTLKRFLSEARIEDDNWKASSIDLEDMFFEYSAKCTADGNLNICKEQELQTDGNNKISGSVKAGATSEETTKKKKKKKSEESDVKAGEDKSDALEKNEDDTVSNVSSKKPKDKKKNRSMPVTESPLAVDGEEKSEPLLGHKSVDNNSSTPKVDVETKDEKKKKKKEKKKNKPTIDSPALEDAPDSPLEEKKVKAKDKKGTEVLDSVTKESLDDTLKKDKKSSKRKRLTEAENKNEPLNEETIKEEEPKRRKTDAVGEVQAAKSEDQINGDGYEPSKDQPNEHENGKLENNEGKSARKKSATKHINGSAEPKSVKAFQRVKIDEVEFADEKLQDNSYWAKDGAEIGYGAKAQEVLGQVRGRDFRHEKTKKKRGSYRGGQIDLDSHSIKFNYSDED